ncbi:transporter [Rhodoferax lacus]|uniref:Transporter n=1 Tax=Rhodoferax lacus TaxID=2184758 RepID=A0A3E1R892_9BURK|nr:Tim44-like domain-containing protein [Rhodoferax lacus]RFO95584.1 transporter [Rhodoferax lacus]
MKRLLSLLAVVFAFGLSTLALDAEAAKRLGSGKSMGTQRQAAPDKAPAAATPSAGAPAAGAAGAAAASPARSWMGPVAGLAAGLGLAALASHLGFGDELASLVMMGLLAAAVMLAIGFFLRKRAAAQQGTPQAPQGMQFARVNGGLAPDAVRRAAQDVPAYKVSMPAGGRSSMGPGTAERDNRRIPADFDTAGFERNARVYFLRLQAANDACDLDDIRQFTTPEMFAELQLDMHERGKLLQKTEVTRIEAEVTDVEEDADHYLVSVRCTGVLHGGNAEAAESFDEIWHWARSRQDNGGWVLSGIQQHRALA